MTVTEPQTFEADGRAIAYVDEGEGPALVLIPGEGQNISYFEILAHILSDEGFRVVRIDAAPADGIDPAQRAQDVVGVLDAIGLADAWIGGHGTGGAVARAVSVAHTDRVNGVLLLSVVGAAASTAETLAASVPVLILHGTEDTTSPLSAAERLQTTAPDRASIVRIDGGDHLFLSTHVGETAAVIEDYLDWD